MWDKAILRLAMVSFMPLVTKVIKRSQPLFLVNIDNVLTSVKRITID